MAQPAMLKPAKSEQAAQFVYRSLKETRVFSRGSGQIGVLRIGVETAASKTGAWPEQLEIEALRTDLTRPPKTMKPRVYMRVVRLLLLLADQQE